MRRPVETARLRKFMQALGAEAEQGAQIYLTGGASAVLLGWRPSTIDIDLEMVPEQDSLLRAIPALKEELEINVELASPAHFIPELPHWQQRSRFIAQERLLSFYHYDFYAQALSKIERAHDQDLKDVEEMLRQGLVEPKQLKELFDRIALKLYRFPSIHPDSFRLRMEEILTKSD